MGDPNNGKSEHIKNCFDLIQMLYDHPMVNRTQSLFTLNVMDKDPDSQVDCHFSVRVKGRTGSKTRFIEQYSREFRGDNISIHHMTGRMDFMVVAHGKTLKCIDDIRKRLTKSKDIERLETHLTKRILPVEAANVINLPENKPK
ncbi:MAG: hypothetical protein Q9M22_01325 [Mariprofundaceae bacterium]|nr:hypothetical protein [Mariprofundaceae bacterium]